MPTSTRRLRARRRATRFATSLWLLGSGRGRPRRGELFERAERTTGGVLARFELEAFATRRHFLLELLIGERHGLHDENVHVVDGAMAESRPVARIDDVPVGRR